MSEKEIATYLTHDVLQAICKMVEAIGDDHGTMHTPSGAEISFLLESHLAKHIEPVGQWFEEFWNAYNYKVGKGKALRVAQKLSQKMRDEIMESVYWYDKWLANTGTSKKHPATYLNPKDKHWQDHLPSPRLKQHLGIAKWVFNYFQKNWKRPVKFEYTVDSIFERSLRLEHNVGEFSPDDVQRIAKWMCGWPDKYADAVHPHTIFIAEKWHHRCNLAASWVDQKSMQHG